MRITIAKKLCVGFGLMISLTLGQAWLSHVQTKNNEEARIAILETDVRSTIAEEASLSEIHRSLACLRGYMLLGMPEMIEERAAAWKSLDIHIDEIHRAHREGDTAGSTRLAKLAVVLEKLRAAQQEIENVAQTPENQPGRVRFEDEVRPLAMSQRDLLAQMISEEKSLEATAERKLALAAMADAQGAVVSNSSALGLFMIGAAPTAAEEMDATWSQYEAALETLETYGEILTDSQKSALSEVKGFAQEYAPLPEELSLCVRVRNGTKRPSY